MLFLLTENYFAAFMIRIKVFLEVVAIFGLTSIQVFANSIMKKLKWGETFLLVVTLNSFQ